MKIFSTFSGIGGFEIGIHSAWLSHVQTIGGGSEITQGVDEEWQGLHAISSERAVSESRWDHEHSNAGIDKGQPTCVGYSEIDKYASSVYEHNFPGAKNYGDITKINEKKLPDFDCLVGGFPCQAFSIAGKRRGFEDTRGTLFFDLARILREKQPRYFVFENVKGLLSHDNGNTFRTIITATDELGYDVQWQVLNSKNFGVPQNRERVYIVGHLRGTPRPEVFPISGSDGEAAEPKRGDKIAIPVLTPDRIVKRQNGRRFKTDGEPAFTVNTQDRHGVLQLNNPTLNTMQGGNRQPFVQVPEATKKGYAEATIGDAINLSNPNSMTRRGRVSDVAPTLDTGMQLHTLTEDVRIRRLTPIECERLQGFPDQWTALGVGDEPISDTQRYKMCGNAVTTNVVQAVFERIFANANA